MINRSGSYAPGLCSDRTASGAGRVACDERQRGVWWLDRGGAGQRSVAAKRDGVNGPARRRTAAQDLAELDIDLEAITQAGRLEVDADAVAVCREDQCGEVRNGEGSGRYWTRRFNF